MSTLVTRTVQLDRRWRWAAVLAWMGVIFAMSAQSDSGQQSGFLTGLVFQVLNLEPTPQALHIWEHLLRKTAHFTEYAILALLWIWALPAGRWRFALAWLAATLYAASDEFHQAFVPNRGPSPFDVLIDSSGALTATLLSLFLWRRR